MQIFCFHPSPEELQTPHCCTPRKQDGFAPIISHDYNSGYLRLALGMGKEFIFHSYKIKPVKSFFCKCYYIVIDD